jgi:hypothetical protein
LFKRIPYDEWFDTFKPIPNHITGDCDTSCSFETYGDELHYVLQQDDKHIWTEMDGDQGVSIVSGYHLVNRIQYYITVKPWDDFIEIPVSIDKECDCMSEGEGMLDCDECRGNGYITIWIDTREEMEEIYGTENV